MEKTKVLLISDLHLGMEKTNSLTSAGERTATLKKITSLAHKYDILMIAGDLIDNEDIDTKYFDILKEEFTSLIENEKEIFYSPGPGELDSGGLLNPAIEKIPTTFTFSDNNDEFMFKSRKGEIFIYGMQSCSRNKEWTIRRTGKKGFHTGLFHADFNPQSSGVSEQGCIKKDDIKKMNLDFYALGKNHTFKMFRFGNKILGAYPGSPEPCSIDETGDRFAISIEIEGNTLSNIKRIAVNTGKILSDEIDCGTVINQEALFEKIRSTYPEQSILNITLTGERDFLLENSFKTGLSEYFRGLKICDISQPSLKIMIDEKIKNDSLEGIFFRILEERLINQSSEKIRSGIITQILTQKKASDKSEGAVLCDF